MISVFIVAEVRLYREGLNLALARKSGIKVVGTCDRLGDMHASIQELRPDIILLDMLVADGVLVLDELKRDREPPKIIAIGVSNDDPEIVALTELVSVHKRGVLPGSWAGHKRRVRGWFDFWFLSGRIFST